MSETKPHHQPPSEPGWDEEPTVVRDETTTPQEPEEPPFRVEHTVRIRPGTHERRALPFKRPDGPDRRLPPVEEHAPAQTADMVPGAHAAPLPFGEIPHPAPGVPGEASVWSREAAIDPRDLPSSLAPHSSEPPPSLRAPRDDASRAVAALVVVSIAVIVALVALALFVLR